MNSFFARYITSYIIGLINKIYTSFTRKYNKKHKKRTISLIRDNPHKDELYSSQEGNDYIKEKILSGKPFAAVRIGGCEMNVINGILALKHHCGFLTKKRKNQLVNNAGFFPYDDNLFEKFAYLNLDLLRECDAYLMYNWVNSSYIYDNFVYPYGGKAFHSDAAQPYFFANPWSEALREKKVLVIHPFSSTIEKQYALNKDKLFRNKKVLVDFELLTLKAVQTIAGTEDPRFDSWFEALDWMTNEALKKDFDIAIIGCGAYGLPLALKLKKAGKQAVHMGGATQILFGIIGKRWETEPISTQFNEYWIYPNNDDKINGIKKVENGCYW